MKKYIIVIALLTATAVKAQQPKQDSLVVQITMDSTTFKNIVSLIQENINGQTKTGQLLLQSIIAPLYQGAKLVPREAVKPKEVTPIKK